MRESRSARGRRGESLAEALLVSEGYRVVERNWRRPSVEIDRVAEHEGCLVFVEIRARTEDDAGHPIESVGPGKQRRVARGALVYLAEHPELGDRMIRFDVVTVWFRRDGRVEVERFPNAFDASGVV